MKFNEWKLMIYEWKLNIKVGVISDVGKQVILTLDQFVSYGESSESIEVTYICGVMERYEDIQRKKMCNARGWGRWP